jgi:hypothetical protein
MAKQTFTTGQVLLASQLTSLQQTAMNGGAASAKTASYTLVAADAGTAISMTSTSATTITVNTGIFSDGDTVLIQNLGSGTCTITAGTATVNTAGSLILPQYDAGILKFVSASSAVFYDFIQVGATSPLTTKGDLYGYSTSDARIPIGADNTVLTADSNESLGLKWAAPASVSFVGASAYLSSNQSIANATYTALQFGSENFDTDSFHDNSVNNTRMTIPAGKGGKYLITALVSWASNSTADRRVGIYKNGSAIAYSARINPSSTDDTAITNSYVAALSVGDYVEIFAFQSSGVSLNVLTGGGVESNFTVTYLGA